MPVILKMKSARMSFGSKKELKPWQSITLILLARPLSLMLGPMAAMIVTCTLRLPLAPEQGWAALGLALVYSLGALYYRGVERQCVNELADRRLIT
jgi:hypothetical protein